MKGTRQGVLRFKLGAVLWAALTIGLMAVPSARAQVLYGTLVGHVVDQNGAAVPAAKVHITEQGTNVTGTVYRVAPSETCKGKLPGLTGQIVLVVNGKIYRRVPDPGPPKPLAR